MHAFITRKPKLENQNSPDVLVIKPENSIGIEEVRQIQSFLSRKPIQSDHNTVYIHNAHLLTLPAQHALLKTLEEPPSGSQIFLITSFPDQLLPTILSRCELVQRSPSEVAGEEGPNFEKSRQFFDRLSKVGIGERLKILDEAALDRPDALQFLNDLESIIHEQLRVVPPTSIASRGATLSDLIYQTRIYLKANCSVKLSLAHLAINL